MNLSALELPLATLSLFAALGVVYLAACACIALRHFRIVHTSLPQRQPGPDAQAVQFDARDGRASIAGWYLPAAPRQGAVILVHGAASHPESADTAPDHALAQRLREAGMSVLAIDLRGQGGSSPARASYGWHERHDVLGAVDYLLEQGYAPGRIGVLGVSLGASTAVLAAADEPAIGALVADSAYARVDQIVERQYATQSPLMPFFLPGALLIGWLWLGVNLRRVQPLASMPRLRGRPVLVIHSHGDRFVPASDAMAMAQACGGECWRTDGDGHTGSYRALPLAYEVRVLSFFARHLDVQPPMRQSAASRATTGYGALPGPNSRRLPLTPPPRSPGRARSVETRRAALL